MQEVFVDTGDINTLISSVRILTITQSNNAMTVTANVSSLTNRSLANLSNALNQEALTDFRGAQTRAEELLMLLLGQQNCTNITEMKYSNLNISDLLFQLNSAGYVVDYLYNLCEAVETSSAWLSAGTQSIIASISLANDSLSTTEMITARTQILLLLAGGDIQAITQITGDKLDGGFSGSGESGFGSGSGEKLDEPGLMLPLSMVSLGKGISDLRYTVKQLTTLILLRDDFISDAANESSFLQATQSFNR